MRVTSHKTDVRRGNGSPETRRSDGVGESEGGTTIGRVAINDA